MEALYKEWTAAFTQYQIESDHVITNLAQQNAKDKSLLQEVHNIWAGVPSRTRWILIGILTHGTMPLAFPVGTPTPAVAFLELVLTYQLGIMAVSSVQSGKLAHLV